MPIMLLIIFINVFHKRQNFTGRTWWRGATLFVCLSLGPTIQNPAIEHEHEHWRSLIFLEKKNRNSNLNYLEIGMRKKKEVFSNPHEYFQQ